MSEVLKLVYVLQVRHRLWSFFILLEVSYWM